MTYVEEEMVDACLLILLFNSSNVGSVSVESKRLIFSIETFESKPKYKLKPPCMISSLCAKIELIFQSKKITYDTLAKNP